MKTTTAKVLLEVICKCPHCSFYQDISADYDQNIQALGKSHDFQEIKTTCCECEQDFIITSLD